jgi:hypothetical protein
VQPPFPGLEKIMYYVRDAHTLPDTHHEPHLTFAGCLKFLMQLIPTSSDLKRVSLTYSFQIGSS